MKIGIIVRGLTNGGVNRFIKSLLREFDKSKKHKFYLIYNQKEEFEEDYKSIIKIYVRSKNKQKFDYIDSLKAIEQLNLDAVIYPKNIIPFTHYKIKAKKYNIIHDLGYFERKLNTYPLIDTLFMKLFMKKSCIKSNLIFAVSNSTKKEIIKIFDIPPKKIIVINEGLDRRFKIHSKNRINKTLKRLNIKKPFIFYSGEISPRKNLLRVVKAFNQIQNIIPHHMYITGEKINSSTEALNLIKKNKKIHRLGYVHEKDLINLYGASELYLYPSLYEGFGLPILEAQACGCPVLTSNKTSCPEVVGRGGLIVNPYSEKEIRKGILKVLKDKKLKKTLIKKGLENLKRYSWEKTADRVLEEIEK